MTLTIIENKRRKKKVSPRKKVKEKIWGLKRADTEFRQLMLKVVPNKCVFPDCPITSPDKLTVSHYFGRVNKGTRFLVANCDFLCRLHHYWDKQLGWEFQKQTEEKHGWDGRYTLYMKAKLKDQFPVVKVLSELSIKQNVAIKQFQDLMQFQDLVDAEKLRVLLGVDKS